MVDPIVGLVVVASHAESGGERADAILNQASERLASCGLAVKTASRVIWELRDAILAAEQLCREGIDLLVVIHATWVADTVQYVLAETTKVPIVLWALPFTETFSLACVQHFSSVLHARQTFCKCVYGMPVDSEVTSCIKRFALVAKVRKDLANAKVALIGPRQTWRAAGPLDMTEEEWDLTDRFGARIIHIPMSELINHAERTNKEEAEAILQAKHQHGCVGEIEVDMERVLYGCRMYVAIKRLFESYGLAAATAECYPEFSGLTNLPASWLADENIILETEGDLGHTMLMFIMSSLGEKKTAVLAEAGRLDFKEDCLWLAHEGSAAVSFAEHCELIRVLPGGELGVVVAFPLRPIARITVASLCGHTDSYRMLIAEGKTEPITDREWVDSGRKFLAKVRFCCEVRTALAKMLAEGVDHHLIMTEGDITSQLSDFCDLLRIKKVHLGD